MSTKLPRSTTAHGLAVVLLIAAAAPIIAAPVWAQDAPEPLPQGEVAAADAAAPVEDISQAQKYYQEGLELYKHHKYREALNKLHRALALDPGMEKAETLVRKCNGKLQEAAAGADPSATQTFETFDPDSAALEAQVEAGEPELSAEEIKLKRIKELMDEGQYYLDNRKFSKAVGKFKEVLIIAPDNRTAQRLLSEATVGAYDEDIARTWEELEVQRAVIRRSIEETKLLPPGADAKGIQQFNVRLPVAEEESAELGVASDIEAALESHVSVEFDNEHISRIVDFIGEYVSINIIVDERVVAPPQEETATAALTAAPGTVPGMPTTPGTFPGTFPTQPGTNRPGTFPTTRPQSPLQTQRPGQQQQGTTSGYVTDGYVSYIKLDDVRLSDARKALLRPMDLWYAVQPGFLWISTAEKIRTESFEKIETRIYELRNIGAEILPKVVIRN
ncbi:MAG: hypothetical protein JXR94_22400, partial [Candidatus Hydrogenedentes bacterium]|nr:hypothetical protein [Candidatus Hydrogenedentota bacterium]